MFWFNDPHWFRLWVFIGFAEINKTNEELGKPKIAAISVLMTNLARLRRLPESAAHQGVIFYLHLKIIQKYTKSRKVIH